MKKLILLAVLTLAVCSCSITRAQTSTNGATMAPAAASVVLTPAQYEKIDSAITQVVPLIPAKFQSTANAVVYLIGFLAIVGRIVVGWRSNGFFGSLAGIFGGTNNKAALDDVAAAAPVAIRAPRSGRLTGPLAIAMACLAAPFLTGCVSATQNGDIISVTDRGFGLKITATSATTQTPEIWLGFISQTVSLIPTIHSTNTNGVPVILSPNFGSTFQLDNTLNPFGFGTIESQASGNYQTDAGTNATSEPVVPAPPLR